METSLHRTLKERYGPAQGGRSEVRVSGFRIDAIGKDGALVEVQSGALGPLRGKLGRLLDHSPIRVVKPVVVARRIVRVARHGGAIRSARMSPKRGTIVDVFDDLIGLARVFPHANLTIEVLAVSIDEIRVDRKRWPGFKVIDRALREVHSSVVLVGAEDLWSLLPLGLDAKPFTTRDLAALLDRPRHFAQRVAYCLRHAGAVTEVGKSGNSRVYERATSNSSVQVPT